MNGRADVVGKAGKRQLLGAAAAAGRLGALVNVHGESGARKREGGGEAVGTRADDDASGVPVGVPLALIGSSRPGLLVAGEGTLTGCSQLQHGVLRRDDHVNPGRPGEALFQLIQRVVAAVGSMVGQQHLARLARRRPSSTA